MSPVIASKTDIPVPRLMRLMDKKESLKEQSRWCGLPDFEDKLERTNNVYEDVLQLW